MECCLCKGEIDKHYTLEGKMYWDTGHNAQPLSDGRCCDDCNNKVIAERMKRMRKQKWEFKEY